MHKPMYHRHKLHVVALLAVMASLISGGCTQTDEPEGGHPVTPGEGSVTFDAYVCSTSVTRASVSNIHTLKQSGFGVFASITGANDFHDNPISGGFTPNYMYNQKVAWQDVAGRDGSWVYDPVLLWPGMQKVSFFAYSPYTDKATEAIRSWSGINDSGSPKISFSLSPTIDKQVDLLYANALNLINSPHVPLTFKHALARISIQLATDSEIDSNSTFSVNKLTFKSTDLGTSGELNLGTGIWTKIQGVTEHLFSSGADMKKGFMVIPADKESILEITVNYTLTTTDPKLSSGSFTINQDVSKRFSLRLEAGKSYCLNLHVSPHAIEINASVKDWEDENHGWESDQNHDNKLE